MNIIICGAGRVGFTIAKLLSEQKFSMSGMLSEEETSDLGQMKGVDAYIFGGGRYYVDDIGQWKQTKGEYEEPIYIYKIQRNVRVELTYKIVNVETGQIVASKELKKAEKELDVEHLGDGPVTLIHNTHHLPLSFHGW